MRNISWDTLKNDVESVESVNNDFISGISLGKRLAELWRLKNVTNIHINVPIDDAVKISVEMWMSTTQADHLLKTLSNYHLTEK